MLLASFTYVLHSIMFFYQAFSSLTLLHLEIHFAKNLLLRFTSKFFAKIALFLASILRCCPYYTLPYYVFMSERSFLCRYSIPSSESTTAMSTKLYSTLPLGQLSIRYRNVIISCRFCVVAYDHIFEKTHSCVCLTTKYTAFQVFLRNLPSFVTSKCLLSGAF